MDGTPGSPDSALWARVPGHLSPSAATLAIVGDYVSGAVSQPLGRRAMGRSLDNTLRMVQLKPTEWVLCDIRIHALVGGYAPGHRLSLVPRRRSSGDGEPIHRSSPVARGRSFFLVNPQRRVTNVRSRETATIGSHGIRADRHPKIGSDRAVHPLPAPDSVGAVAAAVVAVDSSSAPTQPLDSALDTARRRLGGAGASSTTTSIPSSRRARPRRDRTGPGTDHDGAPAGSDHVPPRHAHDRAVPAAPGLRGRTRHRRRRLRDARLPGPLADGHPWHQRRRRGEPAVGRRRVDPPATEGGRAAGCRGHRRARHQRPDHRHRLRQHDGDPQRRQPRVVFVNIHVDQPWQDPNNAVLAAGAARYPNVVRGRLGVAGRAEPRVVRIGRHAPRHRRTGGGRPGQPHDLPP